MTDQENNGQDSAPLAENAPPVDDGSSSPPPVEESSDSGGDTGQLPKADLGKRTVALIIDGVIAGIVGLVIPGIGGLIGATYMVLRDGMEFDFMNHRSIGKHVMKLHVETLDGSPQDIMMSVKRNWMFAFGPLSVALLFIPIIGWILVPFVGLAALAIGITEIILVLTDAQGRRLGDKIAATIVQED